MIKAAISTFRCLFTTTVPPGVQEMKRLRKEIQYTFEETANGGGVVISSPNKEAVEAIHRFLRFQIEEHETGDPKVPIVRSIFSCSTSP